MKCEYQSQKEGNAMRFLTMVSLSICCILMIGCAQRAANIAPAHISAAKYADWDCKRLLDEKTFVDNALPKASSQQDAAADSDAMMVFLIGVPTSGGGIKSEVARLKGEQEALRNVIRDKDCYNKPQSQTSGSSMKSGDIAGKIKEAKRLFDEKLISEIEFKQMKRKILGLE